MAQSSKYKMPLLFAEQNRSQIDYIFWQVQSALGIEKVNFILKTTDSELFLGTGWNGQFMMTFLSALNLT